MNTALWLDQDVHFQQDPEQISATPPRIDFALSGSEDILWQTAVEWVATHRTMILKAGAPVLKACLMERDDLLQTAHVIAMEQCRRVLREGKLEEFVPLFFGHLYGTCKAEWHRHHHEVHAELDWDNLPDPNPVDVMNVCDGIDPRAARERAIVESFEFMTGRQCEIMKAVLGMEEGRGGLGVREAAVWFEVDHRTIRDAIDQACRRVTARKKVRKHEQVRGQGNKQLLKALARLEALNAGLLKENLSLRRQLGRPVVNG